MAILASLAVRFNAKDPRSLLNWVNKRARYKTTSYILFSLRRVGSGKNRVKPPKVYKSIGLFMY